MKAIAGILIFCGLYLTSPANSPYRNYLLSKIYIHTKPLTHQQSIVNSVVGSGAFIPRFERPKGAIFCRMEDQVTKATKIWLKLGVQ
jgi:hypothetical protein